MLEVCPVRDDAPAGACCARSVPIKIRPGVPRNTLRGVDTHTHPELTRGVPSVTATHLLPSPRPRPHQPPSSPLRAMQVRGRSCRPHSSSASSCLGRRRTKCLSTARAATCRMRQHKSNASVVLAGSVGGCPGMSNFTSGTHSYSFHRVCFSFLVPSWLIELEG